MSPQHRHWHEQAGRWTRRPHRLGAAQARLAALLLVTLTWTCPPGAAAAGGSDATASSAPAAATQARSPAAADLIGNGPAAAAARRDPALLRVALLMARYPYDPARAEALLDAAGLVRDDDGRRATLVLLIEASEPYYAAIARYIGWQLERSVGIHVRLETEADVKVWARRMAAGDFDFALDFRLPWGDPLIDVHRLYHSGSERTDHLFPNTPGYADPAMDALLEAAGRTRDQARRKALYQAVQVLAAEDLPVLWLSHIPFQLAIHRDLDFPLDAWRVLTQPYDAVQWRDKAVASP